MFSFYTRATKISQSAQSHFFNHHHCLTKYVMQVDVINYVPRVLSSKTK